MMYPVDLHAVGLVLGLALILGHVLAFVKPTATASALKGFPRSRAAGTVLIAIAGIWGFILITTMDLGEFAHLRRVMAIAVVAGTVLSWRYMEEFLAVRALGMIALLASEPILEAAFLRPETSRLLVVVLAYVWIILGLFWVGMPWMLRDQITWLTSQKLRLKAATVGGIVYGVAVLFCAVALWK
ncbi:hypothetical protein TSACC_21985 [Terrimicrobium sacchariphilum]|uniref:Uncharacterized protein n=1 Tax=Terrimicrobium sacchariphilum TaxID=690879 RepID=A0A146GAB3_TERSA|nr:hypothetical protein [Terrimicrobium sacchariphilum]GAT33568.1 hypothetical protein TSACC_21985 [Terrimicrobium sacchariphilum]